MFGDHLKQQNHQQKAQKFEKCGSELDMKRTEFENWNQRQSITYSSAGNMRVRPLRFVIALHMFVNDWDSSMSIDTGVRNKF